MNLVRMGLLCFGFLCLLAGQSVAQDEVLAKQKRDEDTRLVEGLRRRRLFDLAELYGREELARPNIDPTTETTLTIELMKTLTARAMLSPSKERAEVWRSVDKIANDFVRRSAGHPRVFLIRVQLGLSHMAHADLLQQELAAEMAPESDREKAFAEIRTSRLLLGELQRDIVDAVPEQRGRPLTDHELTVPQLLSLNNNIRYQLVVCNLNRAKLYGESDRLNRVDALNVVQEKLIAVQRETSEGQPLWWDVKLGQIECFLLLGNPESARTLIESLPVDGLEPNTQLKLLERKLHLAIELGDTEFAQATAVEVNEIESTPPSVDLAMVELAMDMSARASTDERKQEWLNFASKATREIEMVHGAYWGRRAGLVLIEGAGRAAVGGETPIDPNGLKPKTIAGTGTGQPSVAMSAELDLLVRLANQAFDKQRYDDALKAYDRAEAKATQQGDVALAFRLGIRASQVLENQDQHALAAERLLESSKRLASLPIASAAHLRGCWNYAQSLSGETPEQANQFQRMLAEHLRIWPTATSANQVRMWMAGRLQTQKNWQAAFDLYLDVEADSPLAPSAITQASVCARNVLGGMRRQGESTQAATTKMVDSLLAKKEGVADSNRIAMQIFLTRMELDLIFGSNRFLPDSIPTLLAIEASREMGLGNRARAIRAASIGQQTPEQAEQLIAEIAHDGQSLDLSDRCLAAMIDHFSQGTDLTNAFTVRLSLIETALENLAEQDSGAKSASPSETSWLLRKSKALIDLGRHGEAVVVLEELEKRFPRSAEIKMELARSLTLQFENESPEKPLARWRRIAGRLKPHSENWYEAKYNVAWLIFQSGKKAEATKLLKYIQAIPPGWDDSRFKLKFERLLKMTSEGE